MNLGLIGRNIQYSYSPAIHNYWLNRYHIKGNYHLYDCQEDELTQILKEEGLVGVNVTTPYKTRVVEIFDHLVVPYGAVNTLKFEPNGTVSAMNSDFLAAKDIFQGASLKSALVLGSGGAARAIIAALVECKINDIKVCSRCETDLGGMWYPWDERINLMQQCDAVINATSVKDQTLVGGKPSLPKSLIVVDLTYDNTPPFFTSWAQEQGHHTITGKEFLLKQAQYSFHFWTGIFPEISSDLRQVIL